MGQHRVVIVGSGFGGLFAAKSLKRDDLDVTVISRTTHHLFQPLLYQVATGILSQNEIAPTMREILAKQRNVRTLLGSVTDVDVDAREVIWEQDGKEHRTAYDSLIVAAGATQSYFGNDHFQRFAPGLKTIDDAFEVRARIVHAFEHAEVEPDEEERRRLLTFVVVGAGPTGVEMAGQLRELAAQTLHKQYRSIDTSVARVILVDGVEHPLPPFGEKLGKRTARDLEALGVELRMNTMATNVDEHSITLKAKDGSEEVIPSYCKVWSAGVQASELGKQLAERTGAETDRAGRVKVLPDLTLPGHPEVFVIGDMMAVDGVPGVAQGAIQPAQFAARTIVHRIDDKPVEEKFVYKDKGSMATIAKWKAVVQIGKLQLGGFIAWLAWCFLHLLTIAGFKNQVGTLVRWLITFVSGKRSAMTVSPEYLNRHRKETPSDG